MKFSNSNVSFVTCAKIATETSKCGNNIEVAWLSYKKIWQEIKEYHDTEIEKHQKKKTIMKLRREVFLEYRKSLLKTLKSEIDQKLNKMYNKNRMLAIHLIANKTKNQKTNK